VGSKLKCTTLFRETLHICTIHLCITTEKNFKFWKCCTIFSNILDSRLSCVQGTYARPSNGSRSPWSTVFQKEWIILGLCHGSSNLICTSGTALITPCSQFSVHNSLRSGLVKVNFVNFDQIFMKNINIYIINFIIVGSTQSIFSYYIYLVIQLLIFFLIFLVIYKNNFN
jgi:hypothetical protein